jgi:hypothetical protein
MKAVFRALPFLYLFLAALTAFSVGQTLFRVVPIAQAYGIGSSLVPLICYSIIGSLICAFYVVNALFLFKKAKRKTSLILAGISCLFLPLGTILGLLSIFTLTRAEVVALYAKSPDSAAAS